jgi:hypothetical protein
MLVANPQGFSARTYLFEEDGWEAGVLRVRYFREAAEYEVGGKTYQMKRERYMSGPFLLLEDGQVILSAEKTSIIFNRFRFEWAGETYWLKSLDWTIRHFAVLAGEKQVGRIEKSGWISRRSTIDLPKDWPLHVRVFIFWLVSVLWDRQATASG